MYANQPARYFFVVNAQQPSHHHADGNRRSISVHSVYLRGKVDPPRRSGTHRRREAPPSIRRRRRCRRRRCCWIWNRHLPTSTRVLDAARCGALLVMDVYRRSVALIGRWGKRKTAADYFSFREVSLIGLGDGGTLVDSAYAIFLPCRTSASRNIALFEPDRMSSYSHLPF